MENKFDKNECLSNELSMELVELELEQVEMDLQEFINSSDELYDDIEYIIYNKYGDAYHLNYNFDSDNRNYDILYFEHHYTKFWNMNIQAEEYLKLKVKYIHKYHGNDVGVELQLEDECHPTLVLSTMCKEKDVKKTLQSLEDIHNNFDKKINVLKEEIQKLISNFEL